MGSTANNINFPNAPLPSLIACLGIALVLIPSCVQAQGLGAVAMFASNYVYRGYSKSANSPSFRVNLDYDHASGLFGGLWLSRVDFADHGFPSRANLEFFPYLGFHYELAESWRFEASIGRYLFDGKIGGRGSDYNEYSVAAHYRDWVSLRVDVADQIYNRAGAAANFEVSARYPIAADWTVSGGFGYNHATPAMEYATLYWNLGISWFFPYGSVDVRYVDAVDLATSSHRTALDMPGLSHNYLLSLSLGF